MRLDPAGGTKLDGRALARRDYELCRRVQKAHSRTYYFSTRLFPAEVSPHVQALYAFMRYADEIVDNPHDLPLEAQLAVLEDFEHETMAAVSGEAVPNPMLRAYADTVHVAASRRRTITAFMKSMKMDTRVFRYPTYYDLEVVHLRERRRGGPDDVQGRRDGRRRADAHAEALGVAMQLSNFLRDVGEDWRRGRVYLPMEDLARFGYTEQDLASGVVDERFVGLMKFQIGRARGLYEVADEGMKYIPRGGDSPSWSHASSTRRSWTASKPRTTTFSPAEHRSRGRPSSSSRPDAQPETLLRSPPASASGELFANARPADAESG